MRSVIKRIIAILLLSSLLLLSLTGCLAEDKNKETETPTEKPTEAPTEDNKPTEAPTEDNEPTEAPTDNNEPPEPEDDDIIPFLVEYIKDRLATHDITLVTSADKINKIKSGQQALHVAFDPSSCYFVCGYYEDSSFEESVLNRHVDEYTWVKYENESEIREEHEGLGFIVAFQVNRALFVNDIMSKNTKSPKMEHFQLYSPEFVDGFNTKSADIFDETFIYINNSSRNTIYYARSSFLDYQVTFSCVHFNEQYYLSIQLYNVYPSSGHYSKWTYEDDLGEYYEDIFSLMRVDNIYTEITEKETIIFYGLVEIDDFVDIINK